MATPAYGIACFVLDDHRCVRHLREYHEGARESLDIYAFIWGGERNVEARRAGWYPWWITEELRYRHLRPVSEWMLYAKEIIHKGSCIPI